jgi:hypothetical protein
MMLKAGSLWGASLSIINGLQDRVDVLKVDLKFRCQTGEIVSVKDSPLIRAWMEAGKPVVEATSPVSLAPGAFTEVLLAMWPDATHVYLPHPQLELSRRLREDRWVCTVKVSTDGKTTKREFDSVVAHGAAPPVSFTPRKRGLLRRILWVLFG